MSKIHSGLPEKHFVAPQGVEKRTVCSRSGALPTASCPTVTQYSDSERSKHRCTSDHEYIGTKPYMSISEYNGEEEEEIGENGESENTEEENSENKSESEGTSNSGNTAEAPKPDDNPTPSPDTE